MSKNRNSQGCLILCRKLNHSGKSKWIENWSGLSLATFGYILRIDFHFVPGDWCLEKIIWESDVC